ELLAEETDETAAGLRALDKKLREKHENGEWQQLGLLVATMNHLNRAKTEHFMGALSVAILGLRPEVSGIPLMMRTEQTFVASARFNNQGKTDRFMEMLLDQRPELAGLPFLLGAACRANKERSQAFSRAVSEIRSRFLRRVFNVKASEPWERFIAGTDEN